MPCYIGNRQNGGLYNICYVFCMYRNALILVLHEEGWLIMSYCMLIIPLKVILVHELEPIYWSAEKNWLRYFTHAVSTRGNVHTLQN